MEKPTQTKKSIETFPNYIENDYITEIGEDYKKRENNMTIIVTINNIMDGGETVFAESPIAKPANHDPSASIASPDPDPVPDAELALLPNISVPEVPEYPIPYSDPDPDPSAGSDSDPNPC